MLYEQQNSIAEIKTEGLVATKLLENEQAHLENELHKGMRSLKVGLKEQELSNENYIKNLKLVCASRDLLSDTRQLNSNTTEMCHRIRYYHHYVTVTKNRHCRIFP